MEPNKQAPPPFGQQAPKDAHAQKAKKNEPVGPDPRIMEEISSLNRRLKLIETSFSNLRNKVQSVETNELENNKENRRDIKVLEEENDELKKNLREIKENLKIIITELKDSAKKEEVAVIQKYLDIWNPVNFVTNNQAKKIAKDTFEEMQRKHL